MKVLHLQPELNLACGVTRTISQIVNNSSEGFEHHIITLGGDGISRFQSNKVHIKIIERDRNTFLDSILILNQIASYIKKNSIDIVHCHHRYFDSLVWVIKLFSKVKIITSVHSKVKGIRLFSYKADRLIACSVTIKKHLIEYFNIDEKRIQVIFNSADPKSISISHELKQLKMNLGIELDKFVIGFIGRIDFVEKGVDVLLNVFNELLISNQNIHLLLIGDGSNNIEVKSFCNLHKTTTTFISSKENIFDYYNIIDLVVLPSRVDPFPLTMLEAGFMNRPFIGSNVDGIPELISSEENGLLFESGNVEELKAQIIRIYNDRKLGEKLAENLHKKVLDSYTVDKIIPQYEELYTELLIE